MEVWLGFHMRRERILVGLGPRGIHWHNWRGGRTDRGWVAHWHGGRGMWSGAAATHSSMAWISRALRPWPDIISGPMVIPYPAQWVSACQSLTCPQCCCALSHAQMQYLDASLCSFMGYPVKGKDRLLARWAKDYPELSEGECHLSIALSLFQHELLRKHHQRGTLVFQKGLCALNPTYYLYGLMSGGK